MLLIRPNYKRGLAGALLYTICLAKSTFTMRPRLDVLCQLTSQPTPDCNLNGNHTLVGLGKVLG